MGRPTYSLLTWGFEASQGAHHFPSLRHSCDHLTLGLLPPFSHKETESTPIGHYLRSVPLGAYIWTLNTPYLTVITSVNKVTIGTFDYDSQRTTLTLTNRKDEKSRSKELITLSHGRYDFSIEWYTGTSMFIETVSRLYMWCWIWELFDISECSSW